jgi:hypothetical protein
MAVTTGWELWVHGAAHKEVVEIRDNCPTLFKRLLDEMDKLAKLPDPRKANNVKHLKHDAYGWYRLAIYDRHNRVVIRVQVVSRNEAVELFPEDEMPNNVTNKGIEITRLAHRQEVYDHKLHSRRIRIV